MSIRKNLVCFDMCTHQRFITNRYTHNQILVSCGKCSACLQEKAYRRASRIKFEYDPDKIGLFVTLTYDRASCPFVYTSDIAKRSDTLNVYREYCTRRVPVNTRHGIKYLDRRYFELTTLNTIYFPNYDSFDYVRSNHSHLHTLKYRDGKVGVCYYPDVQNFKKRLSINLKRKYNYEGKYKIYSCSEYGETTGRPHFHLLLFISSSDVEIFRNAISEAWPFANHRRTREYTEIAKDVANYISAYVNSNTFVHGFLSDNFKTKHSYSKDFGFSHKLFTLDSVLSKVNTGDLSYLRPIGAKGRETYVNLPLPKYVINRHFPQFKGFSRFNDTEILDILRCFIQPETKRATVPLISFDKLDTIDYSKDDLHKYSVRLTNSYLKYCQTRNIPISESSKEDYIYHFRDTWKVYKSTLYRLWIEDDISPKYKFDNVAQLYAGIVNSPADFQWILDSDNNPCISDFNQFPDNVQKTQLYEQTFAFRSKERKINNYIASQSKYYV